jgi:trimeric autotransporter adhesin
MKNLSFFIALWFCVIGTFSFSQNVGISPSGSVPHPSAGLDVNFADKGLLIPRVSLSNTTSANPVTDPAISLLVYNTAATGDVSPGYYFWNGSAWTRLSSSENSSGSGWLLTGNAGTVTGNNFIGTKDTAALNIRTNDTLRIRITTRGAIETYNTGYSVFIGEGAGANDDLSEKYNAFVGYQAGTQNETGFNNTAIGSYALYSNTTGSTNTASGSFALYSNTSGYLNTANGPNALFSNTTGSGNVAIGFNGLFSNTTGSQNTSIGSNALNSNTTGYYNTAGGANALYSNTEGYFNAAYGNEALNSNTSGYLNTASGVQSMYHNTTGSSNTACGESALFNNTIGSSNTSCGAEALIANSTGNFNTGTGSNSLRVNSTGTENTGNGYNSLYFNATGSANTALGSNSLRTNTSGNTNTAIGYYADVASGNLYNATAIGSKAQAGASNSLVLGCIAGINYATTTVKVGIGTTTPSARLDVVGTVKITDGTQGANKVLTSDANGLASWQTPVQPPAAWSLTGNSGTINGTNFIGTTDSTDFDIRTANSVKIRITARGMIEPQNTGN